MRPITEKQIDVLPLAVIEPECGWKGIGLRDIWAYRELLWVLVARDVLVRYKQTSFGILWAVIQPTFHMVLFTLIFGRLAKMPSEGVPYALFSYAALLPWAYFSGAFNRVTGSMVGARHLITKVYFPRLIIPLSGTLSPLVDFFVAFSVLVVLMIYFGATPLWGIVLLPAFLLLAWATALGTGLWFAAINVHYRDVGHTLPFVTQLWMYATPIVYPASLFPEWVRPYLGLNPMSGVVEGFRWALLHRGTPPGPEIAVSVAVAVVLLISGVFFFKRMERSFADVV
ncbi:MAG: ABC transporter permease [Pseudomonadota bacterium]